METTQTSKKWYQSKTIWGILIAVLAMFMSHLGVTEPVLPENADVNQMKEYVEALKQASNNPQVVISNIMAILGCLFAVYGRFKSETTLTT